MLKKIVFLILFVSSLGVFQEVMAQTAKGDFDLSFNIGGGFGVAFETYGEYYVTDEVSAGLGFGYGSWSALNLDRLRIRNNFIFIGPRASFHFSELLDISPELDLYAGGSIMLSRTLGDDDFFDPFFPINFHAGANYYFSRNLGLHGEVGYGYNFLSAGITIKI